MPVVADAHGLLAGAGRIPRDAAQLMDARRRHAVLDVADVIGDHAARKDRRQIHAPAVGTELHTMVDREAGNAGVDNRSEEHTSELQSLMRISYAVFCLKKKQ